MSGDESAGDPLAELMGEGRIVLKAIYLKQSQDPNGGAKEHE
jgi:hypothetical protein